MTQLDMLHDAHVLAYERVLALAAECHQRGTAVDAGDYDYAAGMQRVAYARLDPLGDQRPVSSEELRVDFAHAALVAPRRGIPVDLTEEQARALADAAVAEAVRLIERDAMRRQRAAAEPVVATDAAGGGDPDRFNVAAHLKALSAVVVVPQRYLWEPYLPLGKLCLLAGDWDTWKTWLALAIAAAGSRGWHLPDCGTGTPADGTGEPWATLYLTNENDPETLRFRLDRLGGDPERVVMWNTAVSAIPTFADLRKLDAALEHVKPRLVVIDPIQSALGHKLNMDKTNEVRAVLDAVAALAAKWDVAALALMHLNKSTTASAKHRIMSSVDFGAAPRSILVSAPDPANPRRGVLAHLKCSIAAKGTSLGFQVTSGPAGVEFGWTGPSDLTADELLSAGPRSERTDTQVDAAVEYLRQILSQGSRTKDAVMAGATERGITGAAVKRAAGKLRVRFGSFGFPRRTTWELPQ